MGFWSTIAKIGAGVAAPFTGGLSTLAIPAIDAIGAAGKGAGAYAQGQAANRGAEFGGQLDLERLLMDRDAQMFNQNIMREREGRDSGSDAWRKLLSSQRVLNPRTSPQLAGQYSVAPRQASDAERSGAEALQAEVMARLQGGNPIAAPTERPMNIDPKLLKPGALERILGIGSAAAPVLGEIFKKRPVPMYHQSGAGD